MAVGKQAPTPNFSEAAAACRAALEAKVTEFTETFASLPTATIKRRFRDATIVMPHGFETEVVIECKTEEKHEDATETL